MNEKIIYFDDLEKDFWNKEIKKLRGNRDLCSWSIKTVDKMLEDNKILFFNEFESYLVENKGKNVLMLKKV